MMLLQPDGRLHVEHMRDLLRRVSYKPRVMFRMNDSHCLMISHGPVDVNNKTAHTVITFAAIMSRNGFFSETEFFTFVRESVRDMEMHEADEWLEIDGKRLWDPHNPCKHKEEIMSETPQRRADDPVNHPRHYTSHPSGIEVIEITRHMGFNLGNVVKYALRCDLKADAIEDLKKAAWYLNDEIKKREQANANQSKP